MILDSFMVHNFFLREGLTLEQLYGRNPRTRVIQIKKA